MVRSCNPHLRHVSFLLYIPYHSSWYLFIILYNRCWAFDFHSGRTHVAITHESRTCLKQNLSRIRFSQTSKKSKLLWRFKAFLPGIHTSFLLAFYHYCFSLKPLLKYSTLNFPVRNNSVIQLHTNQFVSLFRYQSDLIWQIREFLSYQNTVSFILLRYY